MVKVKLWTTAAIVGIAATIFSIFYFTNAFQLGESQADTSYLQPQQTIFYNSYSGIENDTGIVAINGQTYFMTTLGKIDDFYGSDKNSTQFQGVTFTFPHQPHQENLPPVPGGPVVIVDLQFPDGTSEKFSTRTTDEHNVVTTLTVHDKPRAGLTLYGDTMKLLVSSTNAKAPN